MSDLGVKFQQNIESVEDFTFEPPIKGYQKLHWTGRRPFTSTQFYPAQLKESFGEDTDGWMNKIFWGDNLQVMSHLLKEYRGQVDLIYIDPPFDSKADYKKKIEVRGKKATNDSTVFEEKQYTDIWSNDEYLQFMYERLVLLRELLSDKGAIYLHCDWHKVHLLRCIMDEIFGASNMRNEIIWCYKTTLRISDTAFGRDHDVILFYSKSSAHKIHPDKKDFPASESTIKRWAAYADENGFVSNKHFAGSESTIIDTSDETKGFNIFNGIPRDWWEISSNVAKGNTNEVIAGKYPTQKPEALLERIIKASSDEGDLVFDCFMGSGTTQAVAMKLGRRFIGADINLGAIDTSVKRLHKVAEDIKQNIGVLFETDKQYYTGFELYNVNNYDVFRNPVEAKDLLKKALELQDLPSNELYDGEKDGRMVKIMPINRIATRADLNELITNFPYALFDKRQAEAINKPVELITLVCMGHEPDLGAQLVLQMKETGYIIDVEVVDILRDKTNLEFKRESEAEIVKEGNKLVIRDFYPLNLMNKLSMQKEVVDDWRVLTDSVKIDFNYDGAVFSPSVIDVPNDNELVSGIYEIPVTAGNIRVKITDLLSESYEVTIR